jgi:hypothetical protein
MLIYFSGQGRVGHTTCVSLECGTLVFMKRETQNAKTLFHWNKASIHEPKMAQYF